MYAGVNISGSNAAIMPAQVLAKVMTQVAKLVYKCLCLSVCISFCSVRFSTFCFRIMHSASARHQKVMGSKIRCGVLLLDARLDAQYLMLRQNCLISKDVKS